MRRLLLGGTGLLVLVAAAIAISPGIRWRTHLVLLQATGQIPDMEWGELTDLLSPRSAQSLARLVEVRNPYAVIRNPRSSAADVAAGHRLFLEQCADCHAPDGTGGSRAPALVGRTLTHGASDWALFRTIHYGVPNTAMPPHPGTSPDDLWKLVAFVRQLESAVAKTADGSAAGRNPAAVPVTYEEMKAVRSSGRDWLTYSGSYSGFRNSSLAQIVKANVGRLALRWMVQFENIPDMVQCSPLVRDGVMFVTLPPGRVMALDARNGHVIWTFDPPPPPPDMVPLSEAVNRGVAILDDKLFVGTWDARLIALSATTGKLLWETRTEESASHWISSAPLAYRDVVVVGTGLRRGRGVLHAYDAATGKPRWSFDVIPKPGAPHHDSWAGDSWESGGSPTWMTGTYDPESDLLFWGTGNPKPDYDASARAGDNLYSNSVVALKGSTGELAWHFQFTPGDDHDWDSNQVPLLADIAAPGGTRKLLLLANRNGYYYVLERATGRFLKATAFARVNWTAGINEAGRPIPLPSSTGADKGRLVYPSNLGATNWWPPSFDPQTNLVFVPVVERGMVFFPSVNSFPAETNGSFYTVVRALNAESGELVWEQRHAPRSGVRALGGLLSTQGGLVFGGDANQFFALDGRTGQALWSVETGGHVVAAPVTYETVGEQYVVVAAGRALLAFALPSESPPAIVATNMK